MVSGLLLSPSSSSSSSALWTRRSHHEFAAISHSCQSSPQHKNSTRWRTVTMRDRSKNRKPLQKGRNLSIEAIQAIQALKRAGRRENSEEIASRAALDMVMESKVRRLLKFDMMAVLGELQRQDEAFLALQVFEEIRKEHWYKPNLSVYVDLISLLARSGSPAQVEQVYSYLMMERWNPDTKGFNSLFQTLLDLGRVRQAMDCFRLMKLWESDPDEQTFKILILGFESVGEKETAASLRSEAEKIFGSLDFLTEEEEAVSA
ncbi:protein THYLAKOID ASSEMBLY 8-like, chloroplastic [Wolffia australiana]